MTFLERANQSVLSFNDTDASIDFLGNAIASILGDPVATGKMIFALGKTPFMIRDRLFWSKMEKYLSGVFLSEEDCANLRAKLTENKGNTEYAKRLIECIDRAETLQKIQYLINATRCYLTDFISRTTFFRICRAITGTIDEDLAFLRDHIEEANIHYSDEIQGLLISGLVSFSVVGGEETLYSFTPLARLVDQFSISYDNDAKYPNPTEVPTLPTPNVEIPFSIATEEQINGMFDS